MWSFFVANRRWLLTGLLLTFGSSFGQTWFISLFAGEIRAEYGLSDGQWGAIYTAATLAAAALLLGRGTLADTLPLRSLAPGITLIFVAATLAIAFGQHLWLLVLAVFCLRFCGQGMYTHIAFTALGRWFVATRGRAVSIASLGYSLGEVLLPLPVVFLIGLIGWRATWGVTAMLLLLVVLPLLASLLAQDRQSRGRETEERSSGLHGRHWTRGDALRHWMFWALVPLNLTPGFIGTVVFFHQVHVAEVKGWTLASMAPAYPAYAGMTVLTAFTSGWLIDRIGPSAFLPALLFPMAVGIALIGPAQTPLIWALALALIGITQGMSATFWGTFLPWLYGTNHLGGQRSMTTATMVIASAIGPGVTGLFIDLGVDFPDQGLAMAIWCLWMSILMLAVRRKLDRERAAPPPVPA